MQTHVVGVLRVWTGSGRTVGRTCAVAGAGEQVACLPPWGREPRGKVSQKTRRVPPGRLHPHPQRLGTGALKKIFNCYFQVF